MFAGFLLRDLRRRRGDRDDDVHRFAGERLGKTPQHRQRPHPHIERETATGLSGVLRPILQVFEFLKFLPQSQHVDRHGLMPGLRGDGRMIALPAAPFRYDAGP